MLKTSQAISVVCVAHEQRRSRVLVSGKQIFSLFIMEVPQLPLLTTPSFPHPHYGHYTVLHIMLALF